MTNSLRTTEYFDTKTQNTKQAIKLTVSDQKNPKANKNTQPITHTSL